MVPEDQPPAPDAGHETDALVADPVKTAALQPGLQAAFKTVFDPEIPVDIWELGLIYDVFVTDAKVDVVWEPGWTKDRMSDVAKLQLGMW